MHSSAVAARVGIALGLAFAVCFVTGLSSHLIQHPPGWFVWPSGPVWMYRVTQGLHVSTGIASIPLLLIKLWAVSPRFWQWPPVTSVVNGLERGSMFLLVGAAFFELITGLFNVAEFYPWGFFFPPVHYAVAWVAIGALVVHIAVKLPVIRAALSGSLESEPVHDVDDPAASARTFTGPLTRRGLLALAGGAALTTVLATVGDKIPALRRISILAQRDGSGPQGLPVNNTAHSAGVLASATDPAWRLTVVGPQQTRRSFNLSELRSLPQVTATLPISCVEGWSQSATWTGVRLGDLLAIVGGDGRGARMTSLETGLYAVSEVSAKVAADPLTLIALDLESTPLDIDHGYPARLIGPNRPGVLQTKWLSRIEVHE
ncbi:MAG: molybdopterin-dependent oxidoreductase [Nakamurella sp.]